MLASLTVNGSPLDEFGLDHKFRYHGLVANLPADEKHTIEALIKGRLVGTEIITVGPQDIELEFPLPRNLADYMNRHCVARPKGCRDAYIYGLRDANGCYFYVGSTIKSIHSRLQSHKSAAIHQTHHNKRLCKRVLELGVSIVLISTVAETHRFEREYEVIHDFLAKGIELVNSKRAEKYRLKRKVFAF